MTSNPGIEDENVYGDAGRIRGRGNEETLLNTQTDLVKVKLPRVSEQRRRKWWNLSEPVCR